MASEIKKAQKSNPRYSMRSFANKVGISPSALSQILAGKRKASSKLVNTICDRLKLDPEDRSQLLKNFFDRDLNLPDFSADSQDPAARHTLISAEAFSVIADWYHFAVLSLLKTDDFENNPSWIARRLGIDETMASDSLAKLKRLGLIQEDAHGKLTRTHQRIRTSDDLLDLSLQKNQLQTLILAKDAITNLPQHLRDFTTLTVATHPDQVIKAKALIRKFQDELDVLLFSATQKNRSIPLFY